MKSSNTIHLIVIITLLLYLFFILLHIILVRILVHCKKKFSGQNIIFKLILFFNLLFSIFYVFFLNYSIYIYLYIFIVYNSLFYVYFHFYNMSETARRIKILIMIKLGLINNLNDIEQANQTNLQISNRLERLVGMSQITFKNGKYYLKSNLLLTIAIIIDTYRKVLFLNRNKNSRNYFE